jgi:peptidoglycan-associated lipoprotein
MKMRLLSLLAVVLLVTACAGKKQETVDVSTMGDNTGTAGTTGMGVDGSSLGSVAPGSQQDLVVNVGDRVFFAYDQSDLAADARATLERQATWLKTYPNVKVTIEGHADERGTREYNIALGERRAQAVRNYMIGLGIDPSRLSTISYGKERPAVVGSDEASFAQNRRGVTVVE